MQDSQWYPLNWFFWKLMKFFFWLFFLNWKSFREIQKLKIFLKFFILVHTTHLWPFSKSKFNLKSDRVNLVAPASPIECLLYLPNVRAIQCKLGPERLTRLGNSNVLWLPVIVIYVSHITQYFDSDSKNWSVAWCNIEVIEING